MAYSNESNLVYERPLRLFWFIKSHGCKLRCILIDIPGQKCASDFNITYPQTSKWHTPVAEGEELKKSFRIVKTHPITLNSQSNEDLFLL